MARLILDENGKRRAFKLNNGRMTLGSGEGCTLRLQSDGVADVHAELRIEDGDITLIPKPGVLPPQLLGQAVKQAVRLAPNAEFHLGGALLRIESDEAGPAVRKSAGAAASSPQRSASGTGGSRAAGVTRQRRQIKKGMPVWLMLGLFAGAASLVFFGGKYWLDKNGEVEWNPVARYEDAKNAYAEGGTKRALMELDKIELDRVTPELRKAVEELRAMCTEDTSTSVVAEHNMKGTEDLDSNIKKYLDRYLAGDKATRPAARLFVKRCDAFKKEYPTHKEIGWVDRFRKRYAKIAEMNSPSTFEDVEWEVKRITAGKPRDYRTVFVLLDRVLDTDAGSAASTAALRSEQEGERQEYYVDRLLQSQFHWKKKEYGKAVEWLVQVIIKIGDKEKEGAAIDSFLKMADHKGSALAARYLESYRNNRPQDFEVMMTFPRLKDAAKEAGLL
jgi:hypothetical protein